MLTYIEVSSVDPDYEWIEVEAKDQLNDGSSRVHLVIRDAQDMVYTFMKRYQAKQSIEFKFSDSTVSALHEFFQDATLAQVMRREEKSLGELSVLLPTHTLHFQSPERSSLRKSKAARVRMFCDDAFQAMQAREFEFAMRRLLWVHLLDPANETAFELKIVCLRSAKKFSECVPVFEQWLEAYPDRLEPRIGLGELWIFLDQNTRACQVFEDLLSREPNHPLGLIGLAQAHARLGLDFSTELTRASLADGTYTREVVEHIFDFRAMHPSDLYPCTLREVSERYRIPLKRLLGRAQRGVLPFHLTDQEGLLLFSESELERYYDSLKRLGLEIESQPLAQEDPDAKQLDLFGNES